MAPRMYLALDAAFMSSASIEELGETHGPGGPLAMVALMGLAKQGGNGGMAVTTKRKLATEAFLANPDDAERIVMHAIDLGTLEGEVGERSICVRFLRWGDWQNRQKNADKQALHRAGQSLNGGDPEHAESSA